MYEKWRNKTNVLPISCLQLIWEEKINLCEKRSNPVDISLRECWLLARWLIKMSYRNYTSPTPQFPSSVAQAHFLTSLSFFQREIIMISLCFFFFFLYSCEPPLIYRKHYHMLYKISGPSSFLTRAGKWGCTCWRKWLEVWTMKEEPHFAVDWNRFRVEN